MAYCRTCGNEVTDNALACTGCGVKPNDGNQFCQECGKETNPKAIMCVACGVNLKKINPVIGNVSVGGSGGAPNDKPVGAGDAILWWLCCMPIGFSQWNQAAKGWLWLVIALLTGFGGIVCLVDYILCYQAQKKRKLDEWEFFPSA